MIVPIFSHDFPRLSKARKLGIRLLRTIRPTALVMFSFSLGSINQMGLQWKEIREKNSGEFCFFLIIYCIFGGYGVLIIAKWLIKVPGTFPRLFK